MPESIYSLKIFQGIERDTVDKIIKNCDERKFVDGEMILVEGEASNGEGYIIKSGRVSIRIKGTHIAELGAGDIFGEIALLNEEARTASVVVTGDLEVIILTIDNLIDMINNGENSINKTIMHRIEENLERA
ncbi:cyclic nucleotide-binding domain-containing protein [Candidatus Gracilibacteria bacterium 28_42_T64]|nr:cyclic nucleotide-binding domain-containing protein [Candidatus Gracilibacteria bacterium 28_42_T64]